MLPHIREIRREVIRIVVHALIGLAAIPFVIYAAISWRDHGFPISFGHHVPPPGDDGSFWALVIGVVLLVYAFGGIVRAVTDARDIAHGDSDD